MPTRASSYTLTAEFYYELTRADRASLMAGMQRRLAQQRAGASVCERPESLDVGRAASRPGLRISNCSEPGSRGGPDDACVLRNDLRLRTCGRLPPDVGALPAYALVSPTGLVGVFVSQFRWYSFWNVISSA
jgi:hypothetical protein